MSVPSTDVVIVNWNSGDRLRLCIQSLLNREGALHRTVRSVTVVDNGSTDISIQSVSSPSTCAPNLRINIDLVGRNLGFAAACNRGSTAGESEYLLFLNPDAQCSAAVLDASVAFLDANQSYGVVGPALRDSDGLRARSCARLPTVTSMLAHSVGVSRFLPSTGYVLSDWPHSESRDVDHVIGAFYMIRRSLFKRLEGFDERFFLYLEDLDLSARVRESGFKIRYLSEVEAFHEGGGSSASIPDVRLFYSWRARTQYSRKHFNSFGATLILLATMIVEPLLRLASAAFSGKAKQFLHGYRATLMFWKWLAK